jgi:hypothetical protein
MLSVPTALICVELFFLSLRHLRGGDLIEKKKGALCRNSIECEGILTGEGDGKLPWGVCSGCFSP